MLSRQTLALVVDEVRGARGEDRRRRSTTRADRGRSIRLRRGSKRFLASACSTATALVGAVNHIHAFRRGREFASWLGLTPRESSTGGRRYLGRISKRGDVYLRCLLAHGARAVLRSALRTARAHARSTDAIATVGRDHRDASRATTRRRSPWRISSRESSGPSGIATSIFRRGRR